MTSPLKKGAQERNTHSIAVNPITEWSNLPAAPERLSLHSPKTTVTSVPPFTQNERDVVAATGCF